MATTCSDPEVLWGLFSAAYGGKLAEVKSLLKTNGLAADVSDPNSGSTVLQWASSGGSLEVVEWLVKEAGAKVTHRNKAESGAYFSPKPRSLDGVHLYYTDNRHWISLEFIGSRNSAPMVLTARHKASSPSNEGWLFRKLKYLSV